MHGLRGSCVGGTWEASQRPAAWRGAGAVSTPLDRGRVRPGSGGSRPRRRTARRRGRHGPKGPPGPAVAVSQAWETHGCTTSPQRSLIIPRLSLRFLQWERQAASLGRRRCPRERSPSRPTSDRSTRRTSTRPVPVVGDTHDTVGVERPLGALDEVRLQSVRIGMASTVAVLLVLCLYALLPGITRSRGPFFVPWGRRGGEPSPSRSCPGTPSRQRGLVLPACTCGRCSTSRWCRSAST